ncbi:MAG: DUF1801 domain-containing protein [Chloroflexota bacterium]
MKTQKNEKTDSIVFTRPEVAELFCAYPDDVQKRLLNLRKLIFEVAATTEGVGQIDEALRWGQPSYLTVKPKSGSTIRIGQTKADNGQVAMYFHCQTNLVSTFRRLHPTAFQYEGNRAIIFDEKNDIAIDALKQCIALALTYHLNKKRKAFSEK